MLGDLDFLQLAAIGLSGVLLVMIFWTLSSWMQRRAESMLFGWAEQNGYEVLRFKRLFYNERFFWSTVFGKTVYHVTVEDQEAFTHRAWVVCGYWVVGVLAYRVRVVWEEEETDHVRL